MRRKKVEKLKNDIVLSVRYARLKEELNCVLLNQAALTDKKTASTVAKKIAKSNNCVELINFKTDQIEQNFKPNRYLLMLNNELEKQLKLLSKAKNFELIKYNIAFEILMESDFDFSENTDAIFLEKVSEILLGDKNVIKSIELNCKTVTTAIYGKNLAEKIDLVAKTASDAVSIVKKTVDSPTYISKKTQVVLGGILAGFNAIKSLLVYRSKAKRFANFPIGIFAKKLINRTLNLMYAKQLYTSPLEFNKFFKYVLCEINQDRLVIAKEMENQKSVSQNWNKLVCLHNFDAYLVDNILEMSKKEQNRA